MPTKFDFVSPGIELREIDQSQVAPVPEADGLLLIGRSRKGPSMKPVKVNSLENFIDVFGAPMDGVKRGDPWREGNTAAASYAGYAAQAYLASGVGPVKFIRLGGLDNPASTTFGKAGWKVDHSLSSTRTSCSGAIGLFVAPSASTGTKTGTLAAVFYTNEISLALTGTLLDGTAMTTHSASAFVKSTGTSHQFSAILNDGTDNTISFDFNKNSVNFIRNVFNTDPTLFDDASASYFLGETFESQVMNLSGASDAAGLVGFFAGLQSPTGATDEWTNFENELTAAKSGWFIGVRPSQKRLFRIESLDDGEQFQKEYYVVIKDLRQANASKPDATFTIEVRRYDRAGYVEKFANLTLNADSPNYISKKIGDIHQYWEEGTGGLSGKIITEGTFPNSSDLIRITINPGVNRADLPVGFTGPRTLDAVEISGSSALTSSNWITGESNIPNGNADGLFVTGAAAAYTASIEFPTHLLTTQNTYLGSRDYPASRVFGLRFRETNGRDLTIGDVGVLNSIINPHLTADEDLSGTAYVFSLDDIVSNTAESAFYYESGSYGDGTSLSFLSGGVSYLIDDKNIKQFAAPFFGGFDGNNILVENPYNEDLIGTSTSYAKHTIDQALEMVSDRDLIRYDLIAMPGITNSTLNGNMLRQTEERGDALAIVDFDGIFQSAEDLGASEDSTQSITTIIRTINDNGFNTSYGAAYYPNVRMRDTLSGNGSVLFAPPSVAAIGAIAKSEADSQPWFAPAGFQRGGLNPLGGNAGPQVLGTVEHLTKADRDKLYEVNLNPIARFPATGDTVVFGQKTLQQDASALDRINVRRLMNYLKKEIGDIADTILFDQNVQATWNRFKAEAENVLSGVKAQFGVTEYKLVLDETTTTPDLIDRNILYAKVFVKPARAIEFIAVDFVITQSGVEF